MFGLRSDGKRIKNLPPIQRIMPHIMKARHDSQNLFKYPCRCEPLDAFIAGQKENGVSYNYMHLVIASLVRVIALRPETNRFVINGRIFRREKIMVSFVVKKSLRDDAEETTVKLEFNGTENIEDVKKAMDEAIAKNNHVDAKNNTDNKSPVDYWSEQGQYLTKASNDRVNGWTAVREWLKVVETPDFDGVIRPHAKLRIFRNCVNLIRTLPQLIFSQKNPNDAATEPHEITHAPDALRYFCASWTFAATPVETINKKTVPDQMIEKTLKEQKGLNVEGVFMLWD